MNIPDFCPLCGCPKALQEPDAIERDRQSLDPWTGPRYNTGGWVCGSVLRDNGTIHQTLPCQCEAEDGGHGEVQSDAYYEHNYDYDIDRVYGGGGE